MFHFTLSGTWMCVPNLEMTIYQIIDDTCLLKPSGVMRLFWDYPKSAGIILQEPWMSVKVSDTIIFSAFQCLKIIQLMFHILYLHNPKSHASTVFFCLFCFFIVLFKWQVFQTVKFWIVEKDQPIVEPIWLDCTLSTTMFPITTFGVMK